MSEVWFQCKYIYIYIYIYVRILTNKYKRSCYKLNSGNYDYIYMRFLLEEIDWHQWHIYE